MMVFYQRSDALVAKEQPYLAWLALIVLQVHLALRSAHSARMQAALYFEKL